jgi:hypothetical protein
VWILGDHRIGGILKDAGVGVEFDQGHYCTTYSLQAECRPRLHFSTVRRATIAAPGSRSLEATSPAAATRPRQTTLRRQAGTESVTFGTGGRSPGLRTARWSAASGVGGVYPRGDRCRLTHFQECLQQRKAAGVFEVRSFHAQTVSNCPRF